MHLHFRENFQLESFAEKFYEAYKYIHRISSVINRFKKFQKPSFVFRYVDMSMFSFDL